MSDLLVIILIGGSNLLLWIVLFINGFLGLVRLNGNLIWSAILIFASILIFGILGFLIIFTGAFSKPG